MLQKPLESRWNEKKKGKREWREKCVSENKVLWRDGREVRMKWEKWKCSTGPMSRQGRIPQNKKSGKTPPNGCRSRRTATCYPNRKVCVTVDGNLFGNRQLSENGDFRKRRKCFCQVTQNQMSLCPLHHVVRRGRWWLFLCRRWRYFYIEHSHERKNKRQALRCRRHKNVRKQYYSETLVVH